MFFDQAIARLDFFLSFRKCPIRNSLQRIQIIYIDVVQFANGRLYIPRYRKVDDEEWSISAHPQNSLNLCLGYDRVRCGSGTYQNVQVTKFLFPVVKSDGSAPHGLSQCRIRDSKALPDLDVRRLMTDAERENVHFRSIYEGNSPHVKMKTLYRAQSFGCTLRSVLQPVPYAAGCSYPPPNCIRNEVPIQSLRRVSLFDS